MTSHRTGHSESLRVYLWDYQTVKSLLLGKVLFIFGAQSMSYLDPVRGGLFHGIKAAWLPSCSPPYTEVGFLLSVYFTI